MGPVTAAAVVIGTVIGSGVFKKPQLVALNAPYFGLAALAWVGTGLFILLGALAYAEVAVLFPRAGGNYVFLREAYGRLAGFLWGWVEFWIIRFFASWCTPCQQETPLLARFYRGEHGKVALVGLDENDVLHSAMSFTHANGVTYPVGWDPETIAASAYGVAALPQTFFLNASHHVVDRIFGAVTLSDLSTGIALATKP